ncbi:hypothetical protein BB399_04470 [Helicobacter pylori]|nr:hypothetical protein BB450_03580 [Helicobacter pylori]PDW76857.1 hypothetical protein BB422_05875 [Helicobacter pylori]PDW78995.1 hypothetical protein BB380_05055 [Helicobacter pylori]PDX00574.1 hypothetical protein BB399_04470 [Helicobacter pylori]PDX27158.1 hypothetical protein BB458_08530 [Helicobacter pylori]
MHQTPQKRGFKRGGSKEKRFFIKIPQKKNLKKRLQKSFKKKPLKKRGFKKRKGLKNERV